MTESYAPPRCPGGLNTAGRRLWRAVTHAFELRADELELLAAAARLADEIVTLEEALSAGPAMVSGSKGQTKPNGLYSEVRAHRLALARLLAQLGLAAAEEDAGQKRSSAGRRLARQRWNRG